MASALAELREIRDRLAATEGVIEDRLALERIGADGLADLTGAVERAAQQLERSSNSRGWRRSAPSCGPPCSPRPGGTR